MSRFSFPDAPGDLIGAQPGADSAAAMIPVSKNRIARLKRFDMSWQAALDRVDPSKLPPVAQKDLDSLKIAVRGNLARLDAEAATLSQLSPLVPFGPALVELYEARVRIDTMDAEKAAGTPLRTSWRQFVCCRASTATR